MWRGVALLLVATPAWAADPPPGAAMCSGCHGGGGMVAIAGRSPDELTATMEAFRSGARPATLMNRLVRGFTPDEVRAISRWLSEQRS
jgi:cytochrome c553